MKLFVLLICLTCLTATQAFADKDKTSGVTPPDNPVDFTMNSIKRGKRLYASHCVLCHGADGSGDTQMREFLKTPPANLADSSWIYGNRDSDIFNVIKAGRTDRDMPAFSDQLTDERIWQTINYLRYMGGKRPE